MTVRAKRAIIAALALFFLGLVVAIAWQDRPVALQAQEVTSTPITPTPTASPTASWTPVETPTWTPFPTLTETPTPPGFVSPLTTPTFTPTRAIVTQIDQPAEGDRVAGLTPILGSALTQNFRMYQIFIAPAGTEDWQWMYNSFDVIAREELYLWNTVPFEDGFYDIRLRAIRDDGQYIDAFVHNVKVSNANPPTTTPFINALGTYVPGGPIDFGTPTPTLRPFIVQNNERGQGIFEPEVGETVWGLVDIIGTTNGSRGNPFNRYEVAISTAGDMNFSWLYSSENQVWQNTVYTLDTRDFPDGYYDLRLRIVYRDANYDDFILRYLNIANAGRPDLSEKFPNGIYRPHPNKRIGGLTNFVGTATDPDFLRYELAWAPTGVDSWNFITSSDRQIIRGVLARVDVGAMLGSSIDVRLRVVRQDSNYDEYFVRNLKVVEPTPTPTYFPQPTPMPDTPTPFPTPTATPALPPTPGGPEPTWTPLG